MRREPGQNSANHSPLSRRLFLGGVAAAGAGAIASPAAVATAAPVPATAVSDAMPTGADAAVVDDSTRLVAEWAAAPGAHPLVPFVAQAGYRLGARPRPLPVVAKVTDFGAVADGVTDCAPAFEAALRAAHERGGGTVLVPAGTYLLAAPVFMHWSGVVLRGDGPADTVLHFSRPLDDGYRRARQSNGNSRWSWTGGQVWFVAPERKAQSEADDYAGQEGWLPGETLATVASAARGQRTLLVSDTGGLRAGDMVLLEVENRPDAHFLQHLAGDGPGAQVYDWATKAPQLTAGSGGQYVQYAVPSWPVRVEAVLGPRLVQLAQPLRYDLRPEWPARIRALGPTVHDSGVEALTIRNELLPMTPHNQHPGSNGVCFQAVHDCWARDVRVENCDLGFGFTGAKSNTVTGAVVAGRTTHHDVACRMQSHDNLVEDFEIEKFTVPLPSGSQHHGLNVEGLSSGNVYRRGTMAQGTFDTHRALPYENVRTDISLVNTNAVGGSQASGPLFGARFAHWNVRIGNDRSYAVAIADVAPRSISLGIQGVQGTGSGLARDFSGDLESLLLQHGEAPAVTDLYAEQRRQLKIGG
ncbi:MULTISPECIES: glycosyl hydrolase family 28-related protein [unclassified Isoptericola]|uniref:glycosyl hydrolase family 28-related protein n=1 Tax=unclassified Isoptericola TaxID=2623355 RepID=UPI0036614D7A